MASDLGIFENFYREEFALWFNLDLHLIVCQRSKAVDFDFNGRRPWPNYSCRLWQLTPLTWYSTTPPLLWCPTLLHLSSTGLQTWPRDHEQQESRDKPQIKIEEDIWVQGNNSKLGPSQFRWWGSNITGHRVLRPRSSMKKIICSYSGTYVTRLGVLGTQPFIFTTLLLIRLQRYQGKLTVAHLRQHLFT